MKGWDSLFDVIPIIMVYSVDGAFFFFLHKKSSKTSSSPSSSLLPLLFFLSFYSRNIVVSCKTRERDRTNAFSLSTFKSTWMPKYKGRRTKKKRRWMMIILIFFLPVSRFSFTPFIILRLVLPPPGSSFSLSLFYYFPLSFFSPVEEEDREECPLDKRREEKRRET